MEDITLNKPIRIAMIMGKMIGGGVEAVVMNYYRFIDKSSVQFDFIIDSDSTHVPRKEIESLGGRIYEVSPYQKLPSYLSDLKKIFHENNYQVVHSHINALSVFPLSVAKKSGIPIRIAHSHSTASKGEYKKNILKNLLRPFSKCYPTHFMSPTAHAGEWLFGKNITTNNQLIILNNAIDTKRFNFSKSIRSQMRKKYTYSDSDFVIGTVGRFVWQKNHEFLVKTFKKVNTQLPYTKLILVGEGPLKDDLEQLVSELGIQKSVQFIKNSENIEDMYQMFDYFVFPSNYEGLGIVAIEAQIMGLPTLCSKNVPEEVGLTELCDFLELDLEPEHWAEYLINSIENRKMNARISRKEEIQNKNYDISLEASKLVSIYNKLGE